ncbi:hypothetical protein P280DRAFT_466947 [Massarina eburnea CBS 473.64]|uniref:Uncharacterized protein n=1 Tax=Massarina eburnea CBS 473.64 TaxID=1395130 RepID=A0A6A6SC09_9PLEO|nr:hypothetical protein P280DRAFT_466947 [Massarina eburnea CBS 473.64]
MYQLRQAFTQADIRDANGTMGRYRRPSDATDATDTKFTTYSTWFVFFLVIEILIFLGRRSLRRLLFRYWGQRRF